VEHPKIFVTKPYIFLQLLRWVIEGGTSAYCIHELTMDTVVSTQKLIFIARICAL